jgi:peptide deformylase
MTALSLSVWFFSSCANSACGDFTKEEVGLINGCDSMMRVLTIADRQDSLLLRDTSLMFPAKALISDEYTRLEELMVATVTHPSQDGVGIAGPQVGLNRRVVAVQRFDKEGEPFEVYPNIRIVWASDSLAYGPEGCLSVPDRRGEVARSQEIVIEYADIKALREGWFQAKTKAGSGEISVPTRRDTVKGFTAVIFQHEADHLDGILYIDRL